MVRSGGTTAFGCLPGVTVGTHAGFLSEVISFGSLFVFPLIVTVIS